MYFNFFLFELILCEKCAQNLAREVAQAPGLTVRAALQA